MLQNNPTEVPVESVPTRNRLLESAVVLFAEKGFAAASVRDICSEADANIAAINYYFGSKDRLYAEAVKAVYSQCECLNSMPRLLQAPDAPDRLLASWIEWFIHSNHNGEGAQRITLFLRRELAYPTPVLQEIREDVFHPPLTALRELVQAILPATVSDAELNEICSSITAPVFMGTIGAPLSQNPTGPTEAYCQHCVRWAMAGMQAYGATLSSQWALQG